MHSIQCAWLFLCLSLCLISFATAAQAARNYEVEIIGAGQFGALLDRHLEIRRHENDPGLSPEELQRLVDITPQQIRDLLATEGYFSPKVEHELIVTPERKIARFRIDPGEPVRVAAVDIRFTGDIARGPKANPRRMDNLRRRWGLKVGDIFRQADWSGAKNALLKNLLVRDYPAAAIAASEARIDPGRRTAALSVDVDSGPAFTFGELQIDGLKRYPRGIIDELNPIQPGDPYSQEKLNELQARLQDSGYFRSVFVNADIDPAHAQRVPVHLELNENPRQRLAFGVGYSTDVGARGEVRWLDRNFLDRQWRLESNLLLDRDTKRLGAGIFLPALHRGLPGWHPSYDARLERSDITGELVDTVRFGARVTSPVKTDEQSFGLTFLADRQRVGDASANNRQALLASYTYTMRRLDNLITPRRGYVASIELGAGPRGVVNTANIGRVFGSATWLWLFDRRWQPVLRGQIGQVFGAGREDVPNDLLFRTGGDQTVRGYAYNSLGVPQNGAVVGGTVVAVVSAELVYWIKPQWGAAVFTDAGDAAESWRDFRLQHGTGIGARWRSPIGPVNVDLAYAHQTHKPRLHFSVGYGF